tara:strand:+ start:129 stop:347 length:219 start_codon:yes stop_codon:yes gene_type:complete
MKTHQLPDYLIKKIKPLKRLISTLKIGRYCEEFNKKCQRTSIQLKSESIKNKNYVAFIKKPNNLRGYLAFYL